MKKKSLNQFKQFELTNSQMETQKGGIFCELYIGYAEANDKNVNNGQLSKGMELDAIYLVDGMAAALAQGGQNYINKYS